MMKLTLVCLVAAMVMAAQAIVVKEDADGEIFLELWFSMTSSTTGHAHLFIKTLCSII